MINHQQKTPLYTDVTTLSNTNSSVNSTPINKKIIAEDQQQAKNSNSFSVNNSLLTKDVTNVTNSNKELDAIPYIKLNNGLIFEDYTNDTNFLQRMKSMSYNEAESLSETIKQNTKNFPMPCMAITAAEIHKNLDNILTKYQLNDAEKSIFINFKHELNSLAPYYPYERSLVFVYKFLLCKSVVENRVNLQTLEAIKQNVHNKSYINEYIDINNITFYDIKLYLLSNFNRNCSLNDILALPWKQMLNNNDLFIDKLSSIYQDTLLFKTYQYTFPFKMNEVLIPYTCELDIEDINKIWALPLWLVGCSLAEITRADGYDCYSSVFFEHDLYHLSEKLRYMRKLENIYKPLLDWVNIIYNNQSFVTDNTNIKFSAIELAIFLVMHEMVTIGKLGIKQSLEKIDTNDLQSLADLPRKYATTSLDDVKQAAKLLHYLPFDNYTDAEFKQAILEFNNKIDILEVTESDNYNVEDLSYCDHKFKYMHLSPIMPDFMHYVINVANNNDTNINVKFTDVQINCIVTNLRIYYCHILYGSSKSYLKTINTFDKEKFLADKNNFLAIAPFKEEAEWTINLLENSI
jgi:hypothetical protein